MRTLFMLALLLAAALPFAKAQKGKTPPAPANKKWGITWETPKNWTKSAVADGLKFSSKDGSDYMLIKAFDIPADQAAKEALITKFTNEEADISDYAELQKQLRPTTHNGLKIQTLTDDEEPDLEEAEDPEDYEGYWTQIIILEHNNKLIIISLSETYMRRRKNEKELGDIFKSIKAEK